MLLCGTTKIYRPALQHRDLERLFDTAYTREGNDWVGRGAVADIVNAATIAAYEHMLIEWKKEQGILKEL
jgi:hypothetical protein